MPEVRAVKIIFGLQGLLVLSIDVFFFFLMLFLGWLAKLTPFLGPLVFPLNKTALPTSNFLDREFEGPSF